MLNESDLRANPLITIGVICVRRPSSSDTFCELLELKQLVASYNMKANAGTGRLSSCGGSGFLDSGIS